MQSTDSLHTQAFSFKRDAGRLHRAMWWKNVRLQVRNLRYIAHFTIRQSSIESWNEGARMARGWWVMSPPRMNCIIASVFPAPSQASAAQEWPLLFFDANHGRSKLSESCTQCKITIYRSTLQSNSGS